MRAFVFGLLVAAALMWMLGGRSGDAKVGPTAPPAGPAPAATSAALDGVLAADPKAPPLSAGGAEVPQAADMEPLLAGVAQRQAAAIAKAFAWLPSVAPADRQRLLAALQPTADDFASLLGGLGEDNSFLHSAEGRGIASKVVAAAMALPDNEELSAGTRLRNLMGRGQITKEDVAARAFVDDAYRQHRIRVDRWLCDPTNVTGARSHTVAKGEPLARIAAKFRKEQNLKIEDGTIAVLNRITNPNAIQPGQKLKIPVAPIGAVLEKRSYSLAVYVGEDLLRLYWVGHGEHDRTPVTEFVVQDKLAQPHWDGPDGIRYPYGHPRNILGEYFIKFRHATYSGFGAHGTPEPGTICTMSSMGCIRMLAPDIADLFQILPRGSTVTVRASESMRR